MAREGETTDYDIEMIFAAISTANMQDGDSIVLDNGLIIVCSDELVRSSDRSRAGNSCILTRSFAAYDAPKEPVVRIQLCASWYFDGTYVEMYTPSYTFASLKTGWSGSLYSLDWTKGRQLHLANTWLEYDIFKNSIIQDTVLLSVGASPDGSYTTNVL